MSTVEPLPPRPEQRNYGADLNERLHQQSHPGEDVFIDVVGLLRLLWRRKGLIAGVAAFFSILAALLIWQMTPIYSAESQVMIGVREARVVNVEEVLQGLPADSETIQSEIQVIQSRGLAGRVVDQLDLEHDPEFNPSLRVPSGLTALLDFRDSLPEDWAALIYGSPEVAGPAPDPEVEAATRKARIAQNLLSNVKAVSQGRSRVVTIRVESESPAKAAAIANAFSDLYIVAQLEAKFEATERANAWLSERLTGLREKVDIAERAVENFRRDSGLVEGQRVALTNEQLSEISAQLIIERTKRVEAEARLNQVQKLLNSNQGAASASEVLSSPLITRLREQEAEVKRKVAELSEEYGPKHPRIINARAELRDLEEKITAEVGRVVEGLRNEVAVARAREASIKTSLDGMKAEVGSQNSSEVQLRALEREANANRTLLETFLARSKETENQQGFVEPDATILSRAIPTGSPSAPNRKLLLLMAVAAGLALGVALAILSELLDQGFRSLDQMESVLGVHPLGLTPAIGSLPGVAQPPELYLLKRPNSAYAEAIRSLRTGLALSSLDRPPRTVLIASSLPREGKTSVALSLTFLLASLGRRTILVDCDLRRPSIHKNLGVSLEPGLSDLLAGTADLAAVVRRDEKSGAYYITAGKAGPDGAELLGSQQMRQVLASLSQHYDQVIIDSAPTLAVSDTRALARQVDKVVFLVRWAETRREVSRRGLRQLLDAGADVAGVLMTMVDVRRHAKYGFSDSGYYYGKVRKYYHG